MSFLMMGVGGIYFLLVGRSSVYRMDAGLCTLGVDDFFNFIARQLGEHHCREGLFWFCLGEAFPKRSRSAFAPSVLWSNEAWNIAKTPARRPASLRQIEPSLLYPYQARCHELSLGG